MTRWNYRLVSKFDCNLKLSRYHEYLRVCSERRYKPLKQSLLFYLSLSCDSCSSCSRLICQRHLIRAQQSALPYSAVTRSKPKVPHQRATPHLKMAQQPMSSRINKQRDLKILNSCKGGKTSNLCSQSWAWVVSSPSSTSLSWLPSTEILPVICTRLEMSLRSLPLTSIPTPLLNHCMAN